MNQIESLEFPNLSSMQKAAEELAHHIIPGSILALRGSLGAGKTSFAKQLIEALGVNEIVTSPSYSLIHEYTGSFKIAHMDFYRLSNEEEVYDIGAFEYLNSQEYISIIEWPERAEDILPSHTQIIDISVMENDIRRFSLVPQNEIFKTWLLRMKY